MNLIKRAISWLWQPALKPPPPLVTLADRWRDTRRPADFGDGC